MPDDEERQDEEEQDAEDQEEPDEQASQDQESEEESNEQESDEQASSDGRTPSPSLSAKEMTTAAMDALRDLTNHEPEAATGLMWDGDSWIVTIDVLELERVPDTTDLLATYVVQLDDEGSLRGYKRTRRFQRSQASEE